MNIIKIAGKDKDVYKELVNIGVEFSRRNFLKESANMDDTILLTKDFVVEDNHGIIRTCESFVCVFVNLDNKKYFATSVEMSFEEFKQYEFELKGDNNIKIENYTILTMFPEEKYYETINGYRISRIALEDFVKKFAKIGVKGEYRHPNANDMSRFCTVKNNVIRMSNIRFVGIELKCDLTFLDNKVYEEYEPYLNSDKKWQILGCRFLQNPKDNDNDTIITFDLLDSTSISRRNEYIISYYHGDNIDNIISELEFQSNISSRCKKETLKFYYIKIDEELVVQHLFEDKDEKLDMQTRTYSFKVGDYIAIPIVRGNPIRKISINLFEDNCICINKLVDDRMVESDKKA